MDIVTCGGVAIVQASLIRNSRYSQDQASSAAWIFGLFLCQYLILKFYRIWLYPRFFSPLRHVPGPKGGHPLFGQAIKLLQAPTNTALHLEWMKQFPEAPFLRYMSIFNDEVLVCNSPSVCREVYQTHCYSAPKSDWFLRISEDLVGKGLLGQTGAEHKAHRKMLAAPFSFGNILKLHPLFKRKAEELSVVLGRAIDYDARGGTFGSVDCSEIFMKTFLDIIGVAVLGKELSHLDTIEFGSSSSSSSAASRGVGDDAHLESQREEHPFHRAYAEFFAPPDKLKQVLTFASGYFPVRWLPLQANRDFTSAMKALRATVTSLVKERVADVKSLMSNEKRARNSSTDLLTFIIEESMPGGSAEGMPEDILTDHLLQFIGAGHETSANLLSLSLMVMAENHMIQSKVRAEIQELLSTSPDPSYTEVDKMPYLENFLKEVARVYPPASVLYQQTKKDMVIEGLKIPCGTSIELCCAVIQRNPTIWGDDADKVDPDRWVGIPSNDKRLNPWAFSAFSNGPRICIGKGFALLELKTIMVELVRNFSFESVVQQPKYANPSLVLAPNGLRIKMRRV